MQLQIVMLMPKWMPAAVPRSVIVYVIFWNLPRDTEGHTGAKDPLNQEGPIDAYPRVDLLLPPMIAGSHECFPVEETDMNIVYEPYCRARVRRLRLLRRTTTGMPQHRGSAVTPLRLRRQPGVAIPTTTLGSSCACSRLRTLRAVPPLPHLSIILVAATSRTRSTVASLRNRAPCPYLS